MVRAEVYVKYLDPNSSNWTVAMNSLITSIANGTAPTNTFVDGGSPGSTGGVTAPHLGALNKSGETGTAPKAYLNYIIFDRDYVIKDGGFVRVTTAAREYGQDGIHEKLSASITVSEPGYIYLYLSNDDVSLGGAQVEVYFDDFEVEHIKSPVVQSQDYYPFGLTNNSYQRENSLSNQWKFQGQENIDELGLGWDSFKWRNHQPEIGRFFGVDPLSEKYLYNSPYAFSENKVVSHRELEGLEAEPINIEQQVTNVNVSPIWRNGDLLGYNISFKLTEQTTEIQTDDNNVAVATVQTTSVSNHSIRVERTGFPSFRPGNVQRQWTKGYFAKGETAKVTTTTTPISLKKEGSPKSTTSTKYQNTGIVQLTEKNSKKLQDEKTKKSASVGEQYMRFVSSSTAADKRKNRLRYSDGDGPRR